MKRQYSFRLKDDDTELGAFIQVLAAERHSETGAIREMLHYARRHMMAEQGMQVEELHQDLKTLLERQDAFHTELLQRFTNMKNSQEGYSENIADEPVQEAEVIRNQHIADLFSTFGQ